MACSNKDDMAMLAVAGSGLVWGIFWMPLRAMNDAGIQGAWATVLFYILPVVLLLPLYVLRWRRVLRGGWALNFAGLLAGTSLVLYAGALIFTSVVHAMLLYYLTPLWSTLLARVVLGEAISRHRWTTIGLGFLGLLVILDIESGIPWPQNAGDWMGLAAGFIWAFASVQMRRDDRNHGIEFTLVYFLWGSLAALGLTLLPIDGGQTVPSLHALTSVLPWLIPVVVFLVIPPTMAVLWGATVLSPGILGILFMTEISAGTVTAALWTNEPFGLREGLGVVLITSAGLWEPAHAIMKVKS